MSRKFFVSSYIPNRKLTTINCKTYFDNIECSLDDKLKLLTSYKCKTLELTQAQHKWRSIVELF